MKRSAASLIAVGLTLLSLGSLASWATGGEAHGGASIVRQIDFKLTFANRDLVWHGDPASPTALVYVQPGARPIATDVQVTTLVERPAGPSRRTMHEARVTHDSTRVVYAFTREREKIVGTLDDQGRFVPNDLFKTRRDLLPSWPQDATILKYDAEQNALYYDVELPGPQIEETLDFLPLALVDGQGKPVEGEYSIDYTPGTDPQVALKLSGQTLARAELPKVFRRGDVLLGSFDNTLGTYLPEAAYRADAGAHREADASVTLVVPGEFAKSVDAGGQSLVLRDGVVGSTSAKQPRIAIDGRFDDWRNVPGVSDERGDVAPYLEYVPDVDLLEFKVAHDDEHIYLYARVAGQVGRTHADGGRSYFYAYIDVDQNPETGFLPTRDDDCYFGVEIGDDCEVQFEFVDNVFRKSFYGFCGLGGDDDVLRQVLTIGKSQYGRFDEQGAERAHYKSEYIYRDGVTEITEDLKLGSSDSIRVAVSPDGSEVEIASTYAGFLKDRQGKPILAPGQTIDVAAGMESDSKLYPGKTRWGADSTRPIRGYRLEKGK